MRVTWLLLALPVALAPAEARAQTAADRATAEALFRDAKDLMARGNFAAACPKLEESERLDAAPGTVLNLAACHEGEGKLATAWAEFSDALAASRKDGRKDREDLAKAHVAALEPRLPRLTVALAPGADVPGITFAIDGHVVGRASVGTGIPIDPGSHRIEASAPGRATWASSFAAQEGARSTVTVPVLGAAPTSPTSGPDRVEPESLSHARQLGLSLRADVDGQGRGAVAVPEITYGLLDRLSVGAGPILGRDSGLYIGASFYILTGAVKPLVAIGMPMFFVDGARPGVHGAGGIQWDPNRHWGLLLLAGVEAFPNAPTVSNTKYDTLIFVPSAAVEGRL